MEVHMSDETTGSPSGARSLPDHPNLDWLRKQAKRRLDELRTANPSAKLSDAQLELAREHGFPSWRALKRHIDAMTIDGQLFAAAEQGDTRTLGALLEAHPGKLHARKPPYAWTLLHIAAHNGRLDAVNLLLARGLDVNVREKGDNTYAMHWAAAAGHVDVVRRLIDAGGDVVGHGDDHGLEVIGWASCWDGCDDDAHRAIVDLLVAHGARHHIFSAIALDLATEVRRIVAADPSALSRRLTRNENNQTPLHFAVRMNRPAMVVLLLELGADPLAADADGYLAPMYATSPDLDRPVMQAIRRLGAAELTSAERGNRRVNANPMDLVAALSLGDWTTAERLLHDVPDLASRGALHLLSKRNDVRAVRWLLDHGADPNARAPHWDALVTPLHLAAWKGHAEIVQMLLDAGADPHIRDSKHDGDAFGWAEHGGSVDTVRILRDHRR
jgi:ankyrin repeat protein